MAKIKVNGKAEQEYKADKCRIYLTVQANKETSDKASKSVCTQVESLLEQLLQLGIKPEDIEVISDNISENSRYDSDDSSYLSERELSFCIPAEVKAVNKIRQIIENGYEDVSLRTEYFISNEKELQKQLLMDAIADSRARADVFAKATGREVISVHAANLDDQDWEMYSGVGERGLLLKEASPYSLSDQLTPEKIKLSADVAITWIVS